MNLEEEIIAMEENAAATVAAARAEAKRILAGLEARTEALRKEIAERVEKERNRFAEEQAAKLKEELAAIEREKLKEAEEIARAGRRSAETCVRAVIESLIGEKGVG